jgi:septal ring factor EnvC (AmiA/AmiB activator)
LPLFARAIFFETPTVRILSTLRAKVGRSVPWTVTFCFVGKMAQHHPLHTKADNMATFRELKADMAIIQFERADLIEKVKLLTSQIQKQTDHCITVEKQLDDERRKNAKLEQSFKEYKIRSEDERDGLATCLRQQALTRHLNSSEYKEFEIESFSKKIATLEVKI